MQHDAIGEAVLPEQGLGPRGHGTAFHRVHLRSAGPGGGEGQHAGAGTQVKHHVAGPHHGLDGAQEGVRAYPVVEQGDMFGGPGKTAPGKTGQDDDVIVLGHQHAGLDPGQQGMHAVGEVVGEPARGLAGEFRHRGTAGEQGQRGQHGGLAAQRPATAHFHVAILITLNGKVFGPAKAGVRGQGRWRAHVGIR